MNKIVDLLQKLIAPENNWSSFLRKMLSAVLIGSLTITGYNLWRNHERSHWEQLPLHTALDASRDIRPRVASYLDTVVRQNPEVQSIWVYSWPDARSLLPVLNSGPSPDLLPLNYFQLKDYKEVGLLVMEQCAPVQRRDSSLILCPIVAENDSWGVVAFEINGEPPIDHSEFQALAHKLSNIIYHSNNLK